jgi:hypothetical protein
MGEYLSFRKFITPVVVQIVFWIGVLAIIAGTVISVVTEGRMGGHGSIAVHPVLSIVGGIVFLFVWRIWCELVMLSFKLYEELRIISSNTRR